MLHLFGSIILLLKFMIYKSIQNNFLRYLYFKCQVKRVPHSGHNGESGFFSFNTLNYKRNNQNLVSLYKLIVANIDCPLFLERLQFKVPKIDT